MVDSAVTTNSLPSIAGDLKYEWFATEWTQRYFTNSTAAVPNLEFSSGCSSVQCIHWRAERGQRSVLAVWSLGNGSSQWTPSAKGLATGAVCSVEKPIVTT